MSHGSIVRLVSLVVVPIVHVGARSGEDTPRLSALPLRRKVP